MPATAKALKRQPAKRPSGHPTVVPYIAVLEAREVIEFVKKTFGATGRIMGTGSQGGIHSEYRIGDATQLSAYTLLTPVFGLLAGVALLGEPTVFAIGPADGLDPLIRKQAFLLLRLSTLTLPHALAQVMLCEQLYRAASILTGHPYHRD